MLQPIFLLMVLIFLNAVFASAEIAVISMSDLKLRQLCEAGDRRAGKLEALIKQPAKFLATIQVAITLAGFLQSAFAAENFAQPLVTLLRGTGIPVAEEALKSACIVVITLILAYFNLVFGELVPKRVAMKKAEELALKMAGMLSLVAKIFAPLVWLLTASTNFWLRRFGIDPEEEEETVSEEEIRLLLAEGREQGTMVSLSTEEDEAVWDRILAESVHTYYPIFAGRSEDVVGILDGKAYFRMKDHTRDKVMQCAVQKPMLAADSMKANRLFEQMKQQQNYFAVVTDAYGGVTGIVTLCDIMSIWWEIWRIRLPHKMVL